MKRIEKDELVLEMNPDAGAAFVSRADGEIKFGPLVCRARFRSAAGRQFDPVSTLLPGPLALEQEDLDTPVGTGPSLRAVIEEVPGLPARLVWELVLIGREDLLLRLRLENRDSRPLKLYELVPLAYRGADPGLEMGAGYLGWRFFRLGYQSWSPAGSVSVMAEDVKPRFFLPRRTAMNPRTPCSRSPGLKASDWMAQVADGKLGLAALFGFITTARLHSRVEFEVKYDRFRRLEAICDGEGIIIDPGETLSSEWLLFSLSASPLEQQIRYYDLWAKAMNARKPRPASGWCSWYFNFGRFTENTLNRNLVALKPLAESGLEFFQIDEGYENRIGEWKDWKPEFPSGPEAIAQRINRHGFKPGLWLAPFLVSMDSPLCRARPDWLLRNEKGRPVIAFAHARWKGMVMHSLDATHPGVQEWLRDLVRTVVKDYGFSYLKLDFLYAAALTGVRHDRKATGASALRRGLEIIREAAGEETYLLACGCPLGPAVGVVDAMRISPDVDIRWRRPLMDFLLGVPSAPAAWNAIKNNLARAPLHGRLFAADPDCVLLRNQRGGMNQEEIKSLLTVIYLCGGLSFLSEDAAGLAPEKLAWFRNMLPPADKPATAVDLLEKDHPEILLRKSEHSALAAIFNWSSGDRELVLDLARLGLSGSWHLFDYWNELYLGIAAGRVSLGKVPAHGCKYLRLVRADGLPRLLAVNFHMGMGEDYLESEPGPEGKVKVRMRIPGPREGKVWLTGKAAMLRTARLSFRDEWEGLL